MACMILYFRRQAVLLVDARVSHQFQRGEVGLVEVSRCIANTQVCSGSLVPSNRVPAVKVV